MTDREKQRQLACLKRERDLVIFDERQAGGTYQSIGRRYEVTGERIRRVVQRVEREAQRDAWGQAHEANPPKSRPSDVRNEGWWAERKAGATYTSIAKREKISKERVRTMVHRIQYIKLWAWRHPTDETVIRGRTMLDDEDGGVTG